MAPEKLQVTQNKLLFLPYKGFTHTEKIDVYSFGLVLWEVQEVIQFSFMLQICTRRRAFEQYARKMSLPALIAAVCDKGERPVIPDEFPDGQKCPDSLRVCLPFSF